MMLLLFRLTEVCAVWVQAGERGWCAADGWMFVTYWVAVPW
jgi:hypothetical protein